MKRIFAYLFCAFTGGAALVLFAVFVWGLKVGEISDFRSFVAPWVFIIWWGWTAIGVYRKYIHLPRMQDVQRKAGAREWLDRSIVSGTTPLQFAIGELRNAYPLLMEPRYRSSSDPAFDSVVELEEPAFRVTLLVKKGVIERWEFR